MEAYEATRQRHIEHLLPQIGEHFERVTWTAERLHTERTAQLRELIAMAVQRSPWHRDRLGEIDLTTLEADDLRDLPVMTKDDLMGNFDAIVTDPKVRLADVNAHIAKLDGDAYFRDELHAVASGGSSGVRGVFVWGWEAWATVQLTAIRRSLLDRIGDPELASRPLVAMIVAAENATHFTSALSETFATGAIETHRFRVGLPLDEVVAGLNSVGGDNLATYPSMLALLVGEARAGRLQIQPRRILTMAEPLLPETRKAAEEIWHAPVANMWGTSEAGVTAIGCFKGAGMHLTDDLVIVEAVDAAGNPVAAGVRSHKVYVTNLFNLLTPLIRYEISDEVTPAFRREHEQEILSVLMAGAKDGQRWPRLAEVADLLRSATSMRLRTRLRTSWAWEYRHRRVMVPVRVASGIWLVALTAILYGYGVGGW